MACGVIVINIIF